jgi:hypothetical protein
MKSLSVKYVPCKRLLMLLVWQTAVYFNYNIQNCKRSFRISNTVRQFIILYKALTVKTHKILAMVLISAVAVTHTAVRSEPVT